MRIKRTQSERGCKKSMRLIDADAITCSTELTKKIIVRNLVPYINVDDIIEFIDALPTIEAAPVVHGEWELYEDFKTNTTKVRCSVCHESGVLDETMLVDLNTRIRLNKFCPNCGAKMS